MPSPLRAPSLSRPQQPHLSFEWVGETIVFTRYRPAKGRVFADRFALVCQTAPAAHRAVPKLAMLAASDGKTHYVIHSGDLAAFVLAHSDRRIVFHDAASSFWAVHAHLSAQGAKEPLAAWVGLAKKRRLRDTMVLDMLLSLAGQAVAADRVEPRELSVVVRAFAKLEFDDDEQCMARYGEIVGRDWRTVDRSFFRCAVKRALAIARAYVVMWRKALQAMKAAGFDPDAGPLFDVFPDTVRRFGVLTEVIQVAAAIALDAVHRAGVSVDIDRLLALRRACELRVEQTARALDRKYPGVLHKLPNGEFVLTRKTGVPARSDGKLDALLVSAVKEIRKGTWQRIEIPRAAKGGISRSAEAWQHLREKHPFIKLWCAHQEATKQLPFLRQVNAKTVYPHYSLLKATGRTSCESPNIQQVPRDDEVRELVMPSPGHLLLAVDYRFIELVALAAICECRFGHSHLGEVIRAGVDPHCYTAALLLKRDYTAFLALKRQAPDTFKQLRQMAKPINFGVPGGMGAEALVDYAADGFGVQLSLDDAHLFRSELTNYVYPELEHYLADTSLDTLARNLRAAAEPLKKRLVQGGDPSLAAVAIRRILQGTPWKSDGTTYQPDYVDRVWAALADYNSNQTFTHALQARRGFLQLTERLFHTAVPTLTGRVRGGVSYTEERNTQFQGLAADGAKLALARLVMRGYRVVAFVHDEILVELPDEGGYVSRHVVDDVVGQIRAGMEEVTCGVPVSCDYTLATRWSKRAELIEEGDKIYAWQPD